jgi:hypothetical protein
MRNICEFPAILRRELNKYAEDVGKSTVNYATIFDEAVTCYAQCFPVLSKFKNDPLLKPIYDDCIHNVQEIRNVLWKLHNDLTGNEEIHRSVTRKFLEVAEDHELVIKSYLKITKDRLAKSMKDIIDSQLFYKGEDEIIEKETGDLRRFFEEKMYEVDFSEFERFRDQLERQILTQQMGMKGSAIWIVKKLSDDVVSRMIIEINFLNGELLPILKKYEKSKVCGEKIETTLKEILVNYLTKTTEFLTMVCCSADIVIDAIVEENIEFDDE